MRVVRSIPEVDESIVNDLEHIDHDFESSGNGSIGRCLVQRRRMYGLMQGDWTMFVQSVSPTGS
jgi:hypothetical protein